MTVENRQATVAGAKEAFTVIHKQTEKAVNRIFDDIIHLDHWQHIADDISTALMMRLKTDSFMDKQFELNEAQQTQLAKITENTVQAAKDKYLENIVADVRTRNVVERVENEMRRIIEYTMAGIAAEINRGAIINTTAVSADTTGKVNKIVLHHSKDAGDITLPMNGVLLASNCVTVIMDSVNVLSDEELKAELYYRDKFSKETKKEKEEKKKTK